MDQQIKLSALEDNVIIMRKAPKTVRHMLITQNEKVCNYLIQNLLEIIEQRIKKKNQKCLKMIKDLTNQLIEIYAALAELKDILSVTDDQEESETELSEESEESLSEVSEGGGLLRFFDVLCPFFV